MHQLKEIGRLNREGMAACNEGRIQDALKRLDEAGRMARALDHPLHEAKVRNNLGLVQQVAGRFAEAEASFRHAARIAVEQAGSGNILHRTIVRNMVRLEDARTSREADHTCANGHACGKACTCGGACRA